MSKSTGKQRLLIVASSLALGACAAGGGSGSGLDSYTQDPSAAVVKSPFGLCWRNAFWTPAQARVECDPDLIPKPKPAAPPPPPPPAPAPAPAKPAPLAPPAPAPAKPPPAPPKPTTEKVSLASDVLFDFDKATLKSEGTAKLDDLVGKLKAVALEVIIAIGHTDSVGSAAYNQKLSERRAAAVKQYLVSKGIEPNRIYTEGKGLKQPIADNKTKEGRAKNRRVEIEVVGTRTVNK